MKAYITIICITIISILEIILLKNLDASIVLWIGYGIYKALIYFNEN